MIPEQSPAQIAAGLRLRLEEFADDRSISSVIVVESGADSAILGQFFADSVRFVPTLGKGNVLGVRRILGGDPLAKRVVYLVDCDNQSTPGLLGQNDIVVSVNYDLESDLIWLLEAIDKYATTIMMHEFESVGDARQYAKTLANKAGEVAAFFGQVIASARKLNLTIRVTDPKNGRSRRVRIHDLPSFSRWVESTVEETEIQAELSAKLGWSDAESIAILEHMTTRSQKRCKLHQTPACKRCAIRSYASGHEQFSWMLEALKNRADGKLSPPAIDLVLRGASNQDRVASWAVHERLGRWQGASGFELLR